MRRIGRYISTNDHGCKNDVIYLMSDGSVDVYCNDYNEQQNLELTFKTFLQNYSKMFHPDEDFKEEFKLIKLGLEL